MKDFRWSMRIIANLILLFFVAGNILFEHSPTPTPMALVIDRHSVGSLMPQFIDWLIFQSSVCLSRD